MYGTHFGLYWNVILRSELLKFCRFLFNSDCWVSRLNLDEFFAREAFINSEFSSLQREVLVELFGHGHIRNFRTEEFVYLQEDEPSCVYFVVSGHIRLSYLLEDGTPILFSVLPAGESFGELGVFDGGGHAEMATAIGDSSVLAIPQATLFGLFENYGELEKVLGRTVARRYRSYMHLSRILGLKSLAGRLSQCLVRLADVLGDRVEYNGREVLQIGPYLTQTDLGLMARGARGNVNRTLKAWEAEGWIAMDHRRILILERNSLENAAFTDDY